MKKITLLAAIVITSALASCTKNHTCSCTTTSSHGGVNISSTSTIVVDKSTKASAAGGNCASYTETQGGETMTVACSIN